MMERSTDTTNAGALDVRRAVETIRGFIETLETGGVCPADNNQGIIEQLGNAADPVVLPVLREALAAATKYRRQAESELARSDHNSLRSGELDTLRMVSKNMEKRLREAISACTPSGETPVFEHPDPMTDVSKKWWKFWT